MKIGSLLSITLLGLLPAFGAGAAEIHDLRGHYNAVDALRFTSDGRYFLSHSSRGRTVILWSIAHRRIIGRLRHRDLERAALMPRTRGAVSMGNRIRIWDARTGAVMRSFPLPKDPELYPLKSENIQVTPDEKYLVYHSYAAFIFFDLRAGKAAFRIKKEKPGAGGNLIFNPRGTRMLLLADGGVNSISVWSVEKKKKTGRLKAPGRLSCFAMGARGRVVAAGGRGGSLFIWRRDAAGPPGEYYLPDRFSPSHVSVGPRARYVAAASGSGIYIFDLLKSRRAVLQKRFGYLQAMGLSRDARNMVAAGPRGELFMAPALNGTREPRWESALKRTAGGKR